MVSVEESPSGEGELSNRAGELCSTNPPFLHPGGAGVAAALGLGMCLLRKRPMLGSGTTCTIPVRG